MGRGSLVRRVHRSPVITPRPGARNHSLAHNSSRSLRRSVNTNRLGPTSRPREVIIPGSGWTNIALSHSISKDARYRVILNFAACRLTGSKNSNRDYNTLIACLRTASSRF
jgi:hypothetical protein